tara:strand:+ start:147 stop:446 length:300 start_codon:yes stop_codon:yes gene_type:complete
MNKAQKIEVMINTIKGTIVRVNENLDNGSAMIDVRLENGSIKEYMTESRRIPLAKGLFSFYEGTATKNYTERVSYCNIEPKLKAMGIISAYEIKDYLNN